LCCFSTSVYCCKRIVIDSVRKLLDTPSYFLSVCVCPLRTSASACWWIYNGADPIAKIVKCAVRWEIVVNRQWGRVLNEVMVAYLGTVFLDRVNLRQYLGIPDFQDEYLPNRSPTAVLIRFIPSASFYKFTYIFLKDMRTKRWFNSFIILTTPFQLHALYNFEWDGEMFMKLRNTSVRIADNLAEIRTGYFPNTSPGRHL